MLERVVDSKGPSGHETQGLLHAEIKVLDLLGRTSYAANGCAQGLTKEISQRGRVGSQTYRSPAVYAS